MKKHTLDDFNLSHVFDNPEYADEPALSFDGYCAAQKSVFDSRHDPHIPLRLHLISVASKRNPPQWVSDFINGSLFKYFNGYGDLTLDAAFGLPAIGRGEQHPLKTECDADRDYALMQEIYNLTAMFGIPDTQACKMVAARTEQTPKNSYERTILNFLGGAPHLPTGRVYSQPTLESKYAKEYKQTLKYLSDGEPAEFLRSQDAAHKRKVLSLYPANSIPAKLKKEFQIS
jgi:hypothetical protein